MDMSGFYTSTVLPPVKNASTHWAVGWVGPRVDFLEKRIPLAVTGFEPRTSSSYPVVGAQYSSEGNIFLCHHPSDCSTLSFFPLPLKTEAQVVAEMLGQLTSTN
jgi:hypothetical protein